MTTTPSYGSLEGMSAIYDQCSAQDRHLSGEAPLKLEALATTRMAAEILETNRARVRQLCTDGVLPAEFLGGRWYLYRPVVEHYRRNGELPCYEALVVNTGTGRRTILLDITGEAERFVRGRWVTIEGETRGFEALNRSTVVERVPMVMSQKYGVLARTGR